MTWDPVSAYYIPRTGNSRGVVSSLDLFQSLQDPRYYFLKLSHVKLAKNLEVEGICENDSQKIWGSVSCQLL